MSKLPPVPAEQRSPKGLGSDPKIRKEDDTSSANQKDNRETSARTLTPGLSAGQVAMPRKHPTPQDSVDPVHPTKRAGTFRNMEIALEPAGSFVTLTVGHPVEETRPPTEATYLFKASGRMSIAGNVRSC
jgi:hypothetical protein